MTSEDDPVPTRKPILVQAPVKALDTDGRLILIIGTAGFAVASLVCFFSYASLAASDQLWRFWTALLGTALGCIALTVVLITRSRKSDPSSEDQTLS
ncbi:MAG: DUF2530 domain-containing protein [Propionibacteriaceae bacterium]|nr:DUF2530 domain-containing protein [Propionibacteriaceae bacterium]